MKRNGFTLIDLIITLSVLSTLLAVGLPNLATQLQNNRVEATTQNLFAAIELARTKAVFSNSRATIKKQTEWENGWEVFLDKNHDGIRDDDEEIIQQHAKQSGVRIMANTPIKNYVSYVGTGESQTANGAFQAGTFTICPTAKGGGYQLILAKGGRVRRAEINAEKCEKIQ
jgi:type IV fimbrial biogenesis protein FimT